MTDVRDVSEVGSSLSRVRFLEVLGVLTANLRLLILGPLFVGMLSYGLLLLVPPTYESRSILRFASTDSEEKRVPDYALTVDAAAAILGSSDVMLALLPLANWVPQTGSRSVAIDLLRREINSVASKRDGMLTITTYGPSPEQAQSLNRAAIEQLRGLTQPKGKALADLQQRKAVALSTLAEMDKVLPSLTKLITQAGPESDKAATTYSLLLEQRQATSDTLQLLSNNMQAFGDEVFVQSPSLPDRPIKPKKGLIAVIATLGGGVLFLLYIFAVNALNMAAERPEEAKRVEVIRRNLWRILGR